MSTRGRRRRAGRDRFCWNEIRIDGNVGMLLRHVVDPGRGDHDAAMAEARHVLTEAWEPVLGAQAKLSRLKSPFGAAR